MIKNFFKNLLALLLVFSIVINAGMPHSLATGATPEGDSTSQEEIAQVKPLAIERAAVVKEVYIDQVNGNDLNSGVDETNAVKTISKALSMVEDGGTVHFMGAVNVSENTVLDKNLTFFYHKVESALVINPGISFSAGLGKTLTVKADGSSPVVAAISAGTGAVVGDGNYVFDFSLLNGTDRTDSSAFRLEGDGKIQGTSGASVNINLTDTGLLAAGTGDQSKVINAEIVQTYNTRPRTVNVGGSAPYNLENTTYTLNGSIGVRFRFDKAFSMANSQLIYNINLASTFYAIIFATTPNIDNSTIDITKYGSILLDNGTANVTNSIIKVDGIHNQKGGKPYPTKFFGDVANTAIFTFTEDPKLGRIAFTDSAGNSYEYGLPMKHGSDVSKATPLPKVSLTFKSEDGSKSEVITLIKGTSLEDLSGKVSADGVLIDKSKIASLEKSIEAAMGGDNLDFKLLVNGDEATSYSFTDKISEDTTVVLKPIVEGVRYYLNDGSANADKYVFVEKNDGQNSPLSIDTIIGKDSMFGLRSKTFVGWTLDKEGNTAVTEVDPAKMTKLYAKWEDKKAFNVTYYRNSPTASSVANPEVVKATLYEGEHLAGILVDLNENIHLIGDIESQGKKISKAFYQGEFGSQNLWGPWNWIGEYDFLNIILDNYKNLYRTQGWNTAADGSGTYYRGGHTLTAEDFAKTNGELVLYDQWIELEKLKKADAAAIANPDNARPEIKLAGAETEPGDYEKAKDALVIDHSQALNYHAFLNFEKIRKELVTLWGRINEVTEWHGTMNAYFDSRLDFDKNVKILFESTWQVPDMDKLAEHGVTDVKQVEGNPTQWIFTIDKDFLMKDVVTGRVGTDTNYDSSSYSFYEVKLPVKIIPKYDPNGGTDFQKLSFEDFMKPMYLTVYDNYKRGINGYVTKESANKIALSAKPVIIVGGDIQMNINGFQRSGMTLLKYQLKSNAYDEHAKLYPSGMVNARYELVEHNNYEKILEALNNLKTGKEFDSFEGRARNENIKEEDPNNYSDKYDIGVPVYTDENNNEKYALVAIKVQVQKVDDNGNLEFNEDGSPKVEEKIYSDRYYTDEHGKAGSLDQGKALLSGEFDHSRIITFVMQYSEATVNIDVEKSWLDAKGNKIQAPTDKIEVELLRDGMPTGEKVELSSKNEWKSSFEYLKVAESLGAAPYKYTVREVGMSDEGTILINDLVYKASVSEEDNVYKITNTAQEKPVVPGNDEPAPEKPSEELPVKPSEKPPVKPSEGPKVVNNAPKTGEETSISYVLLGLSSLFLIAFVIWERKKLNNHI